MFNFRINNDEVSTMLKSLNKLLAVTALVAALPLASHAGSYYLSASGSGNFTPEHENTIKFFVANDTYTETTIPLKGVATMPTAPDSSYYYVLNANKPIEGVLYILQDTQMTADKIKAKRTYGGGGAVALGYNSPYSSASFEIAVGYDMYGTAKFKDDEKEKDFYGEDAMKALARAVFPLNTGGSLAPYLGVGVGIQQIRTDADKMDSTLRTMMIPGISSCVTPDEANNHSTLAGIWGGASVILDDTAVCPGLGNLVTKNKMKDLSVISQGFAGASFAMQPEMAIFVEYSIDLALKKPQMEDKDQEKTYFERSGIKHRIAAGMKYEF